MNIMIVSALAVTPGMWDCVGLTDSEIACKYLCAEKMDAFDYPDYGHAGAGYCDKRTDDKNIGVEGAPPKDNKELQNQPGTGVNWH